MSRMTLEQINSVLGFELSAEFITAKLNVAECEPGLWETADVEAACYRLVNFILYRVLPLTDHTPHHQEGNDVSNITIAAINERLNLGLTAKFIEEELGIAPVEKVKKSMLWTEDQYQEIIDALGAHIERARHSKASAPAKKAKDEPKTEPVDEGFFGGDDAEGDDSSGFFSSDEPAADEGGDFFGGETADETSEADSFFG